MSKISTYIGFALKSKNIIYGTDSIISAKNKCKLIIASTLLAENSVKKLKKIDDVVFLPADQFELLFGKPKAVAITDANLANAIKQNIDSIKQNLQ